MASGNRTHIGTERYFEDICKGTIYDDVSIPSRDKGYEGFEKRLNQISENACGTLKTLKEQVANRTKDLSLYFLTDREREGVVWLARQLKGLAITNSSLHWDVQDIERDVDRHKLSSKYSMRDVESKAEDVLRSRNPESENLDEFLLQLAMSYLQHRTDFREKNGKKLGTNEYAECVAEEVFCRNFVRSSGFRVTDDWDKTMETQNWKLIDKVQTDLSCSGSNDYMAYAERTRTLDICTYLSKYSYGNPMNGMEEKLKRLRRLEDFDNEVIEIDKTGATHPIDAKLVWENGRNYFRLSVNVLFFVDDDVPQHEVAKRKQDVLDGIHKWGDHPSRAHRVFNDQEVYVSVDVTSGSRIKDFPGTYHAADAVYVYIKREVDYNMSWGGKGVFDWSPDGQKIIWIDDAGSDVAKHEFGHSLGSGDAYGGSIFGPGAEASRYSDLVTSAKQGGYDPNDFVMKSFGPIRDNDIEMVILAFSTGKRQNYQKQFFWSSISDALGRGN